MFRSPRPFVLCAALCGMFAAPMTAEACWFHGLFGPRTTYYTPTPATSYYAPSSSCCTTATTANYAPTTTYYAPATTTTYYTPSSSSCCTTPTTSYYAPAQSTTCNYVPTTSYRPTVISTPVTSYQAVTRSNWLTGWPVTRYRPVTTYVQQVQYQPVTSYRLQCETNYAAPATGYPSTMPMNQPGETGQPTLSPGTATPQDTFRQDTGNSATGQQTNALKPIPDANTNGTGAQSEADDGNSLILNDPSNRTAQANTGWQIRTAVSHETELAPRVIPAVDQKPATAEPVKKQSTNSAGWRASKKN